MNTYNAGITLRHIAPNFNPNTAFMLMTTASYRRHWARFHAHRNYLTRGGKLLRSVIDPVVDHEIRCLTTERNTLLELSNRLIDRLYNQMMLTVTKVETNG